MKTITHIYTYICTYFTLGTRHINEINVCNREKLLNNY